MQTDHPPPWSRDRGLYTTAHDSATASRDDDEDEAFYDDDEDDLGVILEAHMAPRFHADGNPVPFRLEHDDHRIHLDPAIPRSIEDGLDSTWRTRDPRPPRRWIGGGHLP